MAATDVIFRIGTIGVSKAQAELGVLVGVLVKVAQTIAENIKKADEFSDAWSKLTDTQRKNVQAMDTATKGFLSSIDNIKSSGKLAAAGLQPTEKQMAALATVAAATAKNLGEGPEGATTRLDALTDSLIKGNDRGLKPYGIELDKTKTLSEKQADAFAALEDHANGLTIEMEGLDDKWQALNSSIDICVGLTYDWIEGSKGIGDIFDWVTSGLSGFNKMVQDSNGGILDFQYSLEGVGWTFDTLGNKIGAAAASLLGFNDMAASLKQSQDDINAAALASINLSGQENKKNRPPAPPAIKPPKRGGGGGRAPKPEEMTFTPEEVFGGDVDFSQRLYSAEESAANTEALLGQFDQYSGTVDDIMMGMSGITAEAFAQNEAVMRQLEMESEIPGNLEQRLYLLQQENDAEDKRLATLQAIADIDPDAMSMDEKREMWDAEFEHLTEKNRLNEEYMEFLKTKTDAELKAAGLLDQASKQNIASLAAEKAALSFVSSAATQLFTAMWQGSMSSSKAVRKAIAEIMQGMSIEYAVKAVTEGVEAIISLAKQDYTAAAEHAGAAVASAAAAVVCAGAALALGQGGGTGGDKGRNPGNAGGTGGGGAGYYEGSGYGGGQKEESVINIYVEGSMSGLFNNLRVEQRRRNKSGEGGNLGGTF